jgi:hypothetical protein
MNEASAGLDLLLAALDRLGIPYMIGGSYASSIHGVPRSTMDVDLVADIRKHQTKALADELGADFYADAETMQEALQRGRPFNVIHYKSCYKFDLFPLLATPYHRKEFERRQMMAADPLAGPKAGFYVATAEDTILAKLAWFRAGGGTSERQWSDMKGILQKQGKRLDTGYMRHWAPELGVVDLLERLLSENS